MEEFVDVREKAEARYPLYESTVLKTIENGKREFYNKDFYVDVVWREQAEAEDVEFVMVAWEACPTPHYNQTVYKYHHLADELELMWTLPNELECLDMYHNRNSIEQSEWPLMKYVMSFYDKSLFMFVNEKEKEDGTRKFE